MNASAVLPKLPKEEVFNKSFFRQIVQGIYPDCAETSIDWMLRTLREQGSLASVGRGKYRRITKGFSIKKKYDYPHSMEYLELEKFILEAFPCVDLQMWELIQMNDFVNHQISKNVIFVEIEDMLIDTVFDLIHENYPYAMIQPKADMFFRQRAPKTDIVVQKLISEAPKSHNNHSCTPEKILVDLLSKKLTGNLVEKSEYPRIYEDVFKKYAVDEVRMFRYAKRRNIYENLISFLNTKTKVKLMTVK